MPEVLSILVNCGGVAAVRREATPFSIGTEAVEVCGLDGGSTWKDGEKTGADEGVPCELCCCVRSLDRERLNSWA